LKIDLKRWNEEVFGNVERRKKILLEELRVFDIVEEERALGVEESMKKAKIVSELERSTICEEMSWRHKSRVLRVREGDKCTIYLFIYFLFSQNGLLQQKKELHLLLVD